MIISTKNNISLLAIVFATFYGQIAHSSEANLVDNYAAKVQKPDIEPEFINIIANEYNNANNLNLDNFKNSIIEKFNIKNQFIFMADGEILNFENNQDENKFFSLMLIDFDKVEIFSGEDSQNSKEAILYMNFISHNGLSPLLAQFNANQSPLNKRIPKQFNIGNQFSEIKNIDAFNTSFNIIEHEPDFTSNLNGQKDLQGNVKNQSLLDQETKEISSSIKSEKIININDIIVKLNIDNNLTQSQKKWGFIVQNNETSSKVQRGIVNHDRRFNKIDFSTAKSINGFDTKIEYSLKSEKSNDKISQIEIENSNAQKYFENAHYIQTFQKLSAQAKNKDHQIYLETNKINLKNDGNFTHNTNMELPIFANSNQYDLQELSLITGINNDFKISKSLRLIANISSVYYNFVQSGTYQKTEDDIYIIPNFGIYYQLNDRTKLIAKKTKKRGKFYFGDYGFNSQISQQENQNSSTNEITDLNQFIIEQKFDENANLKLNFEHLDSNNKQIKNVSIIEADFKWTLDEIAAGLLLVSKYKYNLTHENDFEKLKTPNQFNTGKSNLEIFIAQKINANNQWGAKIVHQSQYYKSNYDSIILYPDQSNFGFYLDYLNFNGTKIRAEINNPFGEQYLYYKSSIKNNVSELNFDSINFSQDKTIPKFMLSFKKSL